MLLFLKYAVKNYSAPFDPSIELRIWSGNKERQQIK